MTSLKSEPVPVPCSRAVPESHIGHSRSSKTSVLETSCRQDERSRNDLPDTSLRRVISGRLRPSPREHRAPEPTHAPYLAGEAHRRLASRLHTRCAGDSTPKTPSSGCSAVDFRFPNRVRSGWVVDFFSPIASAADEWSIFFPPIASVAAAAAILKSPIDSRADVPAIFFSPIDRFSDAWSIGDLHSRSRGLFGRFLDVSGVSEPSASSTAPSGRQVMQR